MDVERLMLRNISILIEDIAFLKKERIDLIKSNQKLAEDIYDLKVQNKYRVEEIEELQGLKQRMDWTEEFTKQNCDGLVEVNEDLGIIKIKINDLKKGLVGTRLMR